MSITAVLKNYVSFTGDLENELAFDSGLLLNSPCIQELISLSSGNNTIDIPDVDDFVTHGVVIVPPTANEVEPVLKGVNGDTGVTLSASQVTVVQLGSEPPASIVISVAEAVSGFRLIWF